MPKIRRFLFSVYLLFSEFTIPNSMNEPVLKVYLKTAIIPFSPTWRTNNLTIQVTSTSSNITLVSRLLYSFDNILVSHFL